MYMPRQQRRVPAGRPTDHFPPEEHAADHWDRMQEIAIALLLNLIPLFVLYCSYRSPGAPTEAAFQAVSPLLDVLFDPLSVWRALRA